ncbi:hypothetical protein AR687_10630 [Flavobacteriaceae bacterium CRH]|nr:hypothetical protein AR687_10630 [Flavobacteriaceae bacterium CRH]
MKVALIKNSFFIFIACSIVLSCRNKTEKFKSNSIYKTVLNKKIEKESIDSISLLSHNEVFKIILNKVYIENQLVYEIEVLDSKNIIDSYKLPYHFISGNDTLQADELGLNKSTLNLNRKSEEIKNGFIVEFWQSETLFQYIIYFDGNNFYLRSLRRISEQNDLQKEIKICQVMLNDNLKKLDIKKIDLILNNFDDNKNINCN